MKKLFSFLLALSLFAGLFFSLPAVAEEEVLPPIYMKTSLNDSGDNLTVELYTDGLKWTALDFGVKFDPAVLQLVSVNVGSKILTAEARGFDFLTTHKDIAASNQAGFCNFVAAVGSPDCRMTAYAGPFAVYNFAVKDFSRAKVSLGICVATLVDKDGNALLNYTPYGPNDAPVVYQTETPSLFTYGDLNRDGVDVADAMLILQSAVGMISLNEYQLAAAKVAGEAEVSVFDAMLVLQYVVGIVTEFPAEK